MTENKDAKQIKQLYFPTIAEWRKWLEKNHEKESKVAVIRYKKHTGKPSPNYMDLMHEAICFGWIDTTIKRLSEDTYLTNFSKRTNKSKWSKNTLRYGKDLMEKGRMSKQGIKYYLEGLNKPPHDDGIPDNPDVPDYLAIELSKNKTAKTNFENFAPCYRKPMLRWLLRAKLPETRQKRIREIVRMAKANQKRIMVG